MDDTPFTVKVGKLPGRIVEVALYNGFSTVSAAIEAAELEYEDGAELKLNGRTARLEDSVRNGDTVLILEKIRGA